jgi:hypothetical protein
MSNVIEMSKDDIIDKGSILYDKLAECLNVEIKKLFDRPDALGEVMCDVAVSTLGGLMVQVLLNHGRSQENALRECKYIFDNLILNRTKNSSLPN